MRIDVLLSQILFGMTLMTCAFALAQGLGSILGRSGGAHAVMADWTRKLIFAACIAGALALFLAGRTGRLAALRPWGALTPAASADARPTARLLARGDSHGEAEPNGAAVYASAAGVDVVVRASTPEHESLLAQADAALLGRGDVQVLYAMGAHPICDAWRIHLQETKHTREGEPAPGGIVALCVAQPLGTTERAALARLLASGGRGLLVGPVAPENADALEPVLPRSGFREFPGGEGGVELQVAGGALLSGGRPTGFRADIGRVWSDGDRLWPLRAEAGEVQLNGTALTPLALRLKGGARVAWSSIGPRLYGRLQAMRGETWRILLGRVFAYLKGMPFVVASSGSGPGKSLQALVLEGDGFLEEIERTVQALAQADARATFVVSPRAALRASKAVDLLAATGHEIALSLAGEAATVDAAMQSMQRRDKSYGIRLTAGPEAAEQLARLWAGDAAPSYALAPSDWLGASLVAKRPAKDLAAPAAAGAAPLPTSVMISDETSAGIDGLTHHIAWRADVSRSVVFDELVELIESSAKGTRFVPLGRLREDVYDRLQLRIDVDIDGRKVTLRNAGKNPVGPLVVRDLSNSDSTATHHLDKGVQPGRTVMLSLSGARP